MRSHPTRTRARNRLYLIGILPALLMLLVSGRITLLLVEESSGLSAFDAEEYDAARDDFAANQVLNPFEPWLAHFDEGTARHQGDDLRGAVAAYEEAMDQGVPPEWDCRVRNNLALAHEQLGDAALETHGRVAAEEEWLIAREVLAKCLLKTSAGGRDPLDTDSDGTVSAQEADSDGDGTVSAEEYDAAVAGAAALGGEEVDSDGDGTVSAEEYDAAVAGAAALGGEEVDSDGDGTVSAEEYDAAVAGAAALGGEEVDSDGDGTVSVEERSKAIDARVAAKLRGREPHEPPTATDPPPANESVAERERQLAERDRRALDQRRRQEQRREDSESSDPEPDPGDVRIPHW